MTTEELSPYTSMHIHNHRAAVQLSRMEKLPCTKGEHELWIVCKEVQMTFVFLEKILENLKE